jgi:hypothetical protein
VIDLSRRRCPLRGSEGENPSARPVDPDDIFSGRTRRTSRSDSAMPGTFDEAIASLMPAEAQAHFALVAALTACRGCQAGLDPCYSVSTNEGGLAG